MSHILGIDLGTTGSTASVLLDDGKLHTVPSVEKTHSTEKPFPSVVSFFQDGSCLIGDSALEQSIYNPMGTIKRVKKYMGTSKKFKIFGEEYIPQYIAALILMKIKLSAEELTKEKFEHAVITVPAYFDDAKKRATREAGRIAGLNVLQLINEPEAAALAYGAHKISSKTRIMIFDMGAGTLDVSILEADSSAAAKPFQVLAVSGDNELGGIYMDDLIKDYLLRSIRFDDGEFSASDKMYQRFREELDAEEEESLSRKEEGVLAERKRVDYQMDIIAENAKIALSTEEKITIDETIVYGELTDEGESISYEKEEHKLKTELTRKEFEKMIGELLRRAESKVTDALENANLTSDKIDQVVLVGGPTKIPAVRNMLKKLVKEPETDVDPTFAVSNGAAIWGAILNNDRNLPVIYKGVALLSVTPKDLGEQYRDQKGNTSILLMIPKNKPYPTRYTDTFYNNLRNDGKWRDSAPMDVWQGNPGFQKPHDFSQYTKIGHFEIEGLKHGISNEIEVTYELDNDGILTVSAREIGGDAYAELQITKSGDTHIPTFKLEDLRKDAEKIERKTRDILCPYEVPPEEWKAPKNPKYCWMCECLDDAKKILNAHHADCREFFKISKFRLFIQQLEMQYAFAHIQLTHPVYSIGVHNALKENTEPNKRMLTIVLVHELLHALHPDWGHNRIIPEERRLANLAGYFDAFIEMDRLFLSGKMSLCNNHFSSDFDFKEINCD